ncbi:MAG TPA: glycosyltransferase family 2 protein [Polyangiaceae bacterium]|nr:glycosyltransferase family 2 protein [Polyangiaceae bacterium]
MLEGARLAVVIPAYDEERLIATTLATLPTFVDLVIVVDDASRDGTSSVAASFGQAFAGKLTVLRHSSNRGVGASIATGYRAALEAGADVIAVMAGDAQMHPDDLLPLALPVVRGEIDYAKGDRLHHPATPRVMPRARFVVGSILSRLTKWAAGLDDFSDSQCGYTAISSRAARVIDLDRLFPRFGYPNDIVGKLVLAGCSIRDVPVRPVYGDEASGIRPWHVVVIVGLIAKVALLRWARQPELLPPQERRARATISSA